MTKATNTGLSRRRVLKGSAALLAGSVAMPAYLRAQGAPIKVGILQPVTGALAYDGAQGQLGAEAALKVINDKGGIKSLGGAKLEMVFGDARSTPEGGTAEVERMASEGVAAIVGGFASPICLAATQAAVALRSRLSRRRRRLRPDRLARPHQHLPLRAGLRRRLQDRARQPRRP